MPISITVPTSPDVVISPVAEDGVTINVYNGVQLATTAPANLGPVAAVGTSAYAARADHIHLDPVIAHVAEPNPHTQYRLLTNNTFGTISTDYIQFTTSVADPTHSEGKVYWNSTDHTLNLMSEISGSVLQVGQENWVRIVNKTGVQLNDGQVVYLSGAQGNRPTATLAQANSATADRTIGVCTADIANNAEGYVTTFGILRGINTTGFSAGDVLYVSASTPGGLTNVAPASPNHSVRVGYALNSTVNGSIFVSPHAGGDLSGLHDVYISSVADKNALRYVAANSRWENTTQGAWLDTAATWAGLQTFPDTMFKIVDDAAPTKAFIFQASGITAGQTRVLTIPDASIIVAGSASALTSGRVPYATTGGLLTDSDSIRATIGASARLEIQIASGGNRDLGFYTGTTARWFLRANSTAESGADAGTNFQISAFTDAGAQIDSPISITRAAGGTITLARPVTATGTVIVPNGTASAPGIRLTSEATGLYSVGAGRVGVACAGAATADLSAPNGTTLGGVLRLASPSAAEVPQIYQTRADGAFYISGDSGPAAGGGLRVYGSAHATKANCVEFTRGNTVAGYFDGSGNLTCSGTVIVPNGTAAAPGIRLTSEAHGLYRNASTSLGVACAGAYVADFTGASAGNWAAFLRISTITDPGMIIGNSTNSLIIYGSDTGSSQGGQVRVYGSAHGSRASYVEFTRGATVSGYFDGSGKLFLNYTAAGAMRLAGNGDGSTGSIDSIYGDLLKYKRYGYSNSYSAAMLGASTRGISLGVDTSAIAGPSFAGDNNDIIVNRGAVIRCANSGGTDWLAAIKISGGAVSASTPVLEIADSLATFTKPVSITDTTASTTPATGAHVVAGGVGVGGQITGGAGLVTAGISAICGATNTAAALTIGTTNPMTGATQVAIYSGLASTAAATTRVSGFYSAPTMANASYTCSYFAHFDGVGMTVPASVTVTNWHGLIVNAPTFTGTVTNAYGVRSLIASGTNRWNLYCEGTASNYAAGSLFVGTTTDHGKLCIKGGSTPTTVDSDEVAISNGAVAAASGGAFYLGSSNVDGTWKIERATNDLVFYRRESGSYVEKGRIAA